MGDGAPGVWPATRGFSFGSKSMEAVVFLTSLGVLIVDSESCHQHHLLFSASYPSVGIGFWDWCFTPKRAVIKWWCGSDSPTQLLELRRGWHHWQDYLKDHGHLCYWCSPPYVLKPLWETGRASPLPLKRYLLHPMPTNRDFFHQYFREISAFNNRDPLAVKRGPISHAASTAQSWISLLRSELFYFSLIPNFLPICF